MWPDALVPSHVGMGFVILRFLARKLGWIDRNYTPHRKQGDLTSAHRLIQPQTWADDIICTHFLKNYGCWESIWRKTVSSNLFQKITWVWKCVLSRRHQLHTFFQKLGRGWENIWRKVVHINHLNDVPSNVFQNNVVKFSRRPTNNNTVAIFWFIQHHLYLS
jgi:hypothetical protein